MPSQLRSNEKVSFVVAKPFTSRGKEYAVGDDFDQEETKNVETFVRARFIIPVVEDGEDKKTIRHWHRHIRPKQEVLDRLNRDRTQLVLPTEPDSAIDMAVLVDPNSSEETEPETDSSEVEDEEETIEEPEANGYDPGEHTVNEVLLHLQEVDAEERDRIMEAELQGRGRKGILED
jgi:hypothetical protein